MRLPSVFRGLPRTYWVLWVATLIDRLGGFGFTFLSLYLTGAKKLPIDQAAAIVSLGGLGGLAGSLVGGVLADRLGRKRTIVLGMSMSAATMCALALVREPLPIAALWLVYGFTGSAARPASQALIADTVAPEDRLRAFGLLHWSINIGFAIAPAVGGFLARQSYTAMFLADAATTFLCVLLVLFQVPAAPAPPQSEPGWRGVTRVFRDPPYLTYLGFIAVTWIIYGQVECTLPVDLVGKGLTTEAYGLVIALNGVLITLFSPIFSSRLRAADPLRILVVSMVLLGVGFGLNAFIATAPMAAVSVAVWTFGEIISSPANGALLASLAPPDQRGRYSGAYSMAYALARFASPWVGGLVLGRLGSAALWLGSFVVAIVAAVTFAGVAPMLRRRMAELESQSRSTV